MKFAGSSTSGPPLPQWKNGGDITSFSSFRALGKYTVHSNVIILIYPLLYTNFQSKVVIVAPLSTSKEIPYINRGTMELIHD